MDEFKDIKDKINIRYIKSSFIIKNIFSFLSTKQKLNMIMYNKGLQKINLIDIKDYKKINGKYKIVEKKGNGNGREYILNTKILVFEGKYLNYKRNGKGKEFFENEKLIFEGEYSNGKRNGKGKEFFENEKLKFEGEYLNGQRNGKGKEYCDDGKLKFEGKNLNEKRWDGEGHNKNDNKDFEIKNGKGNTKEYNF